MKKDSISALAAESPMAKIPRPPVPSPDPGAGAARSGRVGLKASRDLAPRNGKTGSGGKAGSGDAERGVDADRILSGLIALKKGEFGVRLPVGWTGIAGK